MLRKPDGGTHRPVFYVNGMNCWKQGSSALKVSSPELPRRFAGCVILLVAGVSSQLIAALALVALRS
jgi:hypothetical protein